MDSSPDFSWAHSHACRQQGCCALEDWRLLCVWGWRQCRLGHVILILWQDFACLCFCGSQTGFPERLLGVRPLESYARSWHNISSVTFSYSRQVTMPTPIQGMEYRPQHKIELQSHIAMGVDTTAEKLANYFANYCGTVHTLTIA